MVAQHYRWDFIGLSSQEKPTPQTSEKVVDGSTFYEADTSKLYVFCKTEWYEKESSGGGGSSVNVVQTTGTSTTDVMSQNAVTEALASAGGPTVVQTTGSSTADVMSQDATTKMIFPDITNKSSLIKIGNQSFSNSNASGVFINGQLVSGTSSGIAIGFSTSNPATVGTNGRASNGISIGGMVGKGDNSIAIGNNSYTYSETNDGYSVALGTQTVVNHQNSVALGSYAYTTRNGEVNVGTRTYGKGYNSTNYRVIGGVHDGVDANDAVTVGQINALIDAINSATNSNISHIGS